MVTQLWSVTMFTLREINAAWLGSGDDRLMPDAPIHIAHYSMTGHTADAAARLAARFGSGATTEIIRPVRPPRGFTGTLRIGLGMATGASWAIEPPQVSAGARVLVVATPVWGGRIAPPVRSYLKAVADSYPSVAVLITHSESSPARVVPEIETIVGRKVAATAAISDADRKADNGEGKIERLAADLARLAGPALAPAATSR